MNTYLLFKSLHLIAVISWMAGLLYLPRIFVYHAETYNNKDKNDTFKIMEKRLFLFFCYDKLYTCMDKEKAPLSYYKSN